MAYAVAEEIRLAASKCWADFACLNGNGHCVCPVERVISERYVFVKPKNCIECPYRIPFGSASHVCACPVRNELHRRYGK